MSTDGLLARARRALARGLRFHRPPHAFVLTRERLVHVELPPDGRGGSAARAAARELPPGTFREGAGGAPVAGPGLGEAIAALLPAGGRVTSASLAVPDGFVRVASVDVEPGAAQNARELAEVLRWKVGRLYGDPAPALRVTWSPVGPTPGGGTRFLVLATPEESISSLEAAFATHGVRIGVVEPASLALSAVASAAVGGTGFVVFSEGPNVSTVFLEGGAVRFLRTKETAADPEQALQEIRLAAAFVGGTPAEGPGLDVAGAAVVLPEASPVSERFREFRRESGGREPASLLAALAAAGLPPRVDDPAFLVGLGLLQGAE